MKLFIIIDKFYLNFLKRICIRLVDFSKTELKPLPLEHARPRRVSNRASVFLSRPTTCPVRHRVGGFRDNEPSKRYRTMSRTQIVEVNKRQYLKKKN